MGVDAVRKERFCPIRSLAGFCRKVFGFPRGSAATARERLKVIILCDRFELSRAELERLKLEMTTVVRKYLDIDSSGTLAEVKRHGNSRTTLVATFPLRRGGSC